MPVLIPPDAEPDLTGEELVIDSTTVDASNTPLALQNPDGGIKVIEQSYPAPDRFRVTADSIDTIGDPVAVRKIGNRTVTIKVRCYGSEAIMRARVSELTRKVGKLMQPTASDPSITGTLKRTLNNDDVVIFDILDAQLDVPADWQFLHQNSVECTLELVCKPLGRGTEETAVSFTETTLPEAVFTVTDVKGDVPALGRLVIEDDSGNDQWFVHWGCQPPHLYPGTATASTTAALGYQAEALTAYNGATATALTGASGGTAVKLADVGTGYQAIIGTNLSGTALSHIGSYRVWARLMAGAGAGTAQAGTVSVRLEWRPSAAGKYSANEATEILPAEGGQVIYRDLGMVRVPKVTSGAQKWDGRIVAKSTTGTDDVWVDRLMLVPIDGGYGEGRMVPPSSETPATFVARDDFTSGTATIAGSVLATGGTWSVTGSGGTFILADGLLFHSGTTTSTMFALAGTAQYANIGVSAYHDAGRKSGMLARYKGTGDYLAYIAQGLTSSTATPTTYYEIVLCSGGTAGTIASGYEPFSNTDAVYRQLYVDTSGRWATYAGRSMDSLSTQASGYDSRLAASGTLNTGQFGLIDAGGTATPYSRSWDIFRAWEPEYDAAIFANRKAYLTDRSATHDDSAGTALAPIADYQGKYFTLPAEGMEGGTARLFIKASRNLPESMSDPGIDDISGTAYYTPLYWHIPE